jgi:hypothetical protein
MVLYLRCGGKNEKIIQVYFMTRLITLDLPCLVCLHSDKKNVI